MAIDIGTNTEIWLVLEAFIDLFHGQSDKVDDVFLAFVTKSPALTTGDGFPFHGAGVWNGELFFRHTRVPLTEK